MTSADRRAHQVNNKIDQLADGAKGAPRMKEDRGERLGWASGCSGGLSIDCQGYRCFVFECNLFCLSLCEVPVNIIETVFPTVDTPESENRLVCLTVDVSSIFLPEERLTSNVVVCPSLSSCCRSKQNLRLHPPGCSEQIVSLLQLKKKKSPSVPTVVSCYIQNSSFSQATNKSVHF